MRTAKLRNLLLEAVAAAGAVHSGCTPSSPGAGRAASAEAPAVSAAPTAAVAPASGPAEPRPAASVPPAPATSTEAGSRPAGAAYQPPRGLAAACVEGLRNVLLDLRPAAPFDYAELRQRQGDSNTKPLLAHGRVCASAADTGACHRELQSEATSGFGSACHPSHCDFHVVATDARGVQRLASAADLARFLGPIDTPGEALLLAFANGHWVLGCDGPLPVRSGKGWTLTTTQMVEECPVVNADVTFGIAESGAVQVLGTKNRKKTEMCVGRRPPGLAPVEPSTTSWIGGYLAGAAHLEAASVAAFERLAGELERLGAPTALRARCWRAARDEQRHARVVSRLARRYGAEVPGVAVSDVAPRGALELALDNAVEGCVRETFGAAVGLYQAKTAQDPRVRRAFRRIARDETRHAALAWRIAAWLVRRLSPEQAATVLDARRAAVAALREELSAAAPTRAARKLGLPDRAAALAACAELERTLWSQSSALPRAV